MGEANPFAVTRRGVLAGAVACIAPWPAPAASGRDAALKVLLDGLGEKPDPATALPRLEAFSPDGLSRSARADRDAVIWGLEVDARIASAIEPDFELAFERQFGAPMNLAGIQLQLDAEGHALQQRADALLRRIGLREGSVGARLKQLARDERSLYADSEAGRVHAVADMNRQLAKVGPMLSRFVSPLPADVDTVVVRALSLEEIAAGRQGYRAPAGNGRPAAYVVDLREIRRRPRWTLMSVVHHEMLPGHRVQGMLQEAALPHPLRLRYAPNFSEGWAVYAERLAGEAGLLRGDVRAELGYLQWMLFRIGRGQADIAINALGRSAADVEAYLNEFQGDPVIFAPYAQDLERIAKLPGARAAEAMTALAMRRFAQQRAPQGGARRARVHHAMLADGPVPFRMLRSG